MNKTTLLHLILCSLLLVNTFSTNMVAQNTFSPYPLLKHSYFLTTTHAIKRLNDDQKVSANVLHQRYLNLFSDVYLVDISGYAKIKKSNQLGVIASSSKEGPYISKTNAGIHFASGIKIYKKTTLSAGVIVGMTSIRFDDNNTGANNGRSSTAPDLSIDLLLQHKNYYFFYSYNQLLAIILKPLTTTIKQRKYQEARIGFKLNLGRKIEFSPQGHLLIYENRPTIVGVNLNLTAKSLISIGIASYNFTTALYQLALHIPEINNWKTSITGSYSQLITAKQNNLYFNTFEIGLILSKKDKKLEEVVHELEE